MSNISITVIYSFFCNKKVKYSITFGCLIFSFFLLFFGIDFTDTPYWLNIYKNMQIPSSMVIGTQYIGHALIKIFGDKLITTRILTWIITLLAILIPFFSLIPKQNRASLLYVLSFSFLYLLKGRILNGDRFSLFFISLSLVFFIKYYQNKKLLYLMFFAVIAAFSVYIRFPNIIMGGIVIVLLPFIQFFNNHYKRGIKLVIISEIVFISIYICSIIIFDYIFGNELSGSFRVLNDSIAGGQQGHSLRNMLKMIVKDFDKILLYFMMFIGFWKIMQTEYENRHTKYIVYVSSFLLFTYIYMHIMIHSSYNWQLSLAISAFFIMLIVLDLLKTNKNLCICIIILSFSLIGMAGSDTGILKYATLLVCYMPFLFSTLDVYKENLKRKLPFVVMVFVGLLWNYQSPYEETSICTLSKSLSNSKLEYVYTSSHKAELIENVMNQYQLYKDSVPVIFYGQNSHLFYYLTDMKKTYNYSFRMNIDSSDDILNIEKILQKSRIVFIYVHKLNQIIDSSPLEELLYKYHYKKNTYNGYSVYVSNQ